MAVEALVASMDADPPAGERLQAVAREGLALIFGDGGLRREMFAVAVVEDLLESCRVRLMVAVTSALKQSAFIIFL